jgi:hypothetical protein
MCVVHQFSLLIQSLEHLGADFAHPFVAHAVALPILKKDSAHSVCPLEYESSAPTSGQRIEVWACISRELERAIQIRAPILCRSRLLGLSKMK